jgi:hypothetical protein
MSNKKLQTNEDTTNYQDTPSMQSKFNNAKFGNSQEYFNNNKFS